VSVNDILRATACISRETPPILFPDRTVLTLTLFRDEKPRLVPWSEKTFKELPPSEICTKMGE